jgi:hypothetical protein
MTRSPGTSGSGHEPPGAGGANELLDARDDELLSALRECYETLDPMPGSLIERSLFALAIQDIDTEVFQLAEQYRLESSGARGGTNAEDGVNGDSDGEGAGEEARVVTFDSDSLTIMIRIDANQGESVRVDGWLAPPQSRRVEMRTADASIAVMADGAGRFVFHDVPRGTARVIVHAPEASVAGAQDDGLPETVKSVITPALILLGGG